MPEIDYFVIGDFPCSIWKHNELGHLCGYIGVPRCHPWYGKNYDDITADVHGGLTFCGYENSTRMMSKEYRDVMRAWEPGKELNLPAEKWVDEPSDKPYPHDTGQDIFWVGFDCAHLHDLVPASQHPGDSFKDESYVRNELEGLARQAADAMQASAMTGKATQ